MPVIVKLTFKDAEGNTVPTKTLDSIFIPEIHKPKKVKRKVLLQILAAHEEFYSVFTGDEASSVSFEWEARACSVH